MPQENVEVVRRLYGEFERGNFLGVAQLLDPGVEWQWSRRSTALIGGKSFRGLEQVEAGIREWLIDWEWFSVIGEEFIDAGDHVVVKARTEARLRDGRGAVPDHHTDVITVRDHKVLRMETFDDRSDALEAAGLSE
jgi:ketosteroid isomerase-like protein